jgi:hypothetical protein
MDPGISFVPKGIMDWAMKLVVKKMINKILKLSRNLVGSKWEKKLTDGNYVEFYAWAEKIFVEYIESRKADKVEIQDINKL